MVVIEFSGPAQRDVMEIFDTIAAEAGTRTAASFFHSITRRLNQLESFPFAGQG